ARLDRRAIGLAGDTDRATRGLCDHVEGQALLMRAAGPEALDLAIDNTRVNLLDRFVVQAKALDRPWCHFFGHDIGLLDHLFDDLESPWRFQVQRYRLLVDVELVEVPWVVVGLADA